MNKTETKALKNEILTGIIDQESKTYTFTETVSMMGEEKTGTFTVKYMGVGARLRLGTIRAKLLDGAPGESVDVLTDDIAYMIAFLTVSLQSSPSWWNYDELDDVNDLRKVFEQASEFINSFRKKDGPNKDAGNRRTPISTENVADM